jgi:nicotinamide-nucleotide amidase
MHELCTALAQQLTQRGCMLRTAESCTGGLIAATCTELSGSSLWFDRGYVTYSNTAKTEMLGVSTALIAQHGAVSEPVARAMAEGAVRPPGSAPTHPHTLVSLAVTGVAGPTGGSADKPVGLVWFAWQVAGQTQAAARQFNGDRAAVRAQTVAYALAEVLRLLHC